MHESWLMKRSLSSSVSSSTIDAMYAAALEAGALGGKITGAGGGGFLLLFVPPAKHAAVRESLRDLLHVPFDFETSGSKVIFYDADPDYSRVNADAHGRAFVATREMQPLFANVRDAATPGGDA
jgi:D-glycero-alpha-D-manno-heptose-7-phosphate kinase